MRSPGSDHGWQDIDYTWHPCHWWQDLDTERISAMSLAIAFALLVGLVAIVAVIIDLKHVIRGDGYGHRPAPRSLADESENRAISLTRLAR
jgi:hypothetical protein